MSPINLVPEVKQEQVKIKKLNLSLDAVALVTGIILVSAVLLLSSMLGYRSTKLSSTNKKIEKIQEELLAYKELEESVVTLETGLAEIKGIIDGGKDWTAFFEDIEKATPSDIQFLNFSISGNSITAGLRGGEIKSIDRFIKSFSNYKDEDGNNLYGNVTVDGYSKEETGQVSFQAKFDLLGELK